MISSENKTKKKNDDLTFYIRVCYRRNADMQGSIQWLDGKKSAAFRSVLELGNLINDAAELSAGREDNKKIKQWEDKKSVS
ncbi:MAG: hypothetical protein SVV67_04285 [Bacillota bacterium]|nr:hypothetical protein [Bacillota bacterium]